MERAVDRPVDEELAPWYWRSLTALEEWARPAWGWGVLVACMLLAMLPAVALRANKWVALGSYQSTLEMTGPLAVAIVWLLWGWRRQRRKGFGWLACLVALLAGVVVVSQLLLGWIPGPRAFIQSATSGDWLGVVTNSVAAWSRAGERFSLWLAGVQAGGAAQDNLVFAAVGCIILWLLGIATAWLARGRKQGFAAGAPSLWLLGLILLYSSSGRYLLVVGLALTLVLHIFLEQDVLTTRWQQLHLDYSPGLLFDRLVTVLGAGAMILAVAAVMPNLYIGPLVDRYYAALAPVNAAIESFGERLFPELHGTSRLRGGGVGGGGLPNEFLLNGGPTLGSAVVMRVRTNESANYDMPYDEEAPPPGNYMRGRTLTVYDGRSWSNPDDLTSENVDANQRWQGAGTWGRKQVMQSVILETRSNILFAAPEAVEASADVQVQARGADDVVGLQGSDTSYSVVSLVPAVGEDTLRSLPAWALPGENASGNSVPLPPEIAIHLALPDSVTARTRDLAQKLVAGRTTEYDKAQAIEQYLRQYKYDLEVSQPPADVKDVADYFLFDLQRGYCDYYATAFIVLARIAGLPARFATGFAPGAWDQRQGVFVITESEAHSWPEVYFPEVGWVPFEPTAGRPALTRIGLPQANPLPAPPSISAATDSEPKQAAWNWQPWFWLIPAAGVVWLLFKGWQGWRRRREDPWQALLQWGKKAGRPIGPGETVLEYGAGLAGYITTRPGATADTGRIAAREVQAVSEEVSRIHYGREEERLDATQSMAAHWERLRSYLPLLRLK